MQPQDIEGKGQDLVLTSFLLTTEPSHAQSSWPEQLLFILSASTPQPVHRALAATQIIKCFFKISKHFSTSLEFLRRASPSEQRHHYMFGIEELKQVKTKDKPAMIRMVWA